MQQADFIKTFGHVKDIVIWGKYLRTPDEYNWFKIGFWLTLLFSSPIVALLGLAILASGEYAALFVLLAVILIMSAFILPYAYHNTHKTSRRLDVAMKKFFREDITFSGGYYIINKNGYSFHIGYPVKFDQKGKYERVSSERLMLFFKCSSIQRPEEYVTLIEDIEKYLADKMQGQQYVIPEPYMLSVCINLDWAVYNKTSQEELDDHLKGIYNIFNELAYVADRFGLETMCLEEYKSVIPNWIEYFNTIYAK